MQSAKALSFLQRKIKNAIRGFKKIISRAIRKLSCSKQILITDNEIHFFNTSDFCSSKKFASREV
jgi:hypothetical protein